MKTKNNSACRIFAEQLKMLLSLPNQEEAKTILYQSLINSYNQFENQNDNQTENQNENAYVSVSESLSYLGESILNLLSKNIIWKEFSNNYGGKRENAGRKAKEPQVETIKEDKYRFEGKIIKLNYKDYYSFTNEYPHLDLDRELEGLDRYYSEHNITDWWLRCKNRLRTKEAKAKEESGWHVEGSNW